MVGGGGGGGGYVNYVVLDGDDAVVNGNGDSDGDGDGGDGYVDYADASGDGVVVGSCDGVPWYF